MVDWHNYGYSILSLNVGEKHWLVKFAHWLERTSKESTTPPAFYTMLRALPSR